MDNNLKPLEAELLPVFTDKAPFQLPVVWKELIVKISPWIMLIFVPLSLLAIGLGTLATLLTLFTLDLLAAVSITVSILALVCSLLSIKGLFDRARDGWVWSYYSFLLSALSSLIGLHFISAIIGFLIGGFFLFQIREYYK
jgi:hypothetical protein